MTWMVAPSYAHATIKKVDENTHKAYIEEVCDKIKQSLSIQDDRQRQEFSKIMV